MSRPFVECESCFHEKSKGKALSCCWAELVRTLAEYLGAEYRNCGGYMPKKEVGQ